MKYMLTIFLTLFFAFPALAGVQVYNSEDTSLGVHSTLQCGDGVRCVVSSGRLNLSKGLQNQVTATATTLTSAECGSTFINSEATEVELPEASTVLGCRYTFIVGNASNFTIDPDDGDQIMLLTNAAGDSLIADAVGESLVLEAISASAWAPVGAEKGTWTDSD